MLLFVQSNSYGNTLCPFVGSLMEDGQNSVILPRRPHSRDASFVCPRSGETRVLDGRNGKRGDMACGSVHRETVGPPTYLPGLPLGLGLSKSTDRNLRRISATSHVTLALGCLDSAIHQIISADCETKAASAPRSTSEMHYRSQHCTLYSIPASV